MRLLVRGCGPLVGNPLFDVPHFVMERRMMRGIAERAEGLNRMEVAVYASQHPVGAGTAERL